MRPLGVVVPQHGAALGAEAALGGRDFRRRVVLVKGDWGAVLSERGGQHSRSQCTFLLLTASHPALGYLDALDEILAADNLERVRVSHNVHAAHVSARLAADAALAHLGVSTLSGPRHTWYGTGVLDLQVSVQKLWQLIPREYT